MEAQGQYPTESEVVTNRMLLAEYCQDHRSLVRNTFLAKPPHKHDVPNLFGSKKQETEIFERLKAAAIQGASTSLILCGHAARCHQGEASLGGFHCVGGAGIGRLCAASGDAICGRLGGGLLIDVVSCRSCLVAAPCLTAALVAAPLALPLEPVEPEPISKKPVFADDASEITARDDFEVSTSRPASPRLVEAPVPAQVKTFPIVVEDAVMNGRSCAVTCSRTDAALTCDVLPHAAGKPCHLVLGAQDLDWAHAALVGKDWVADAFDVGRAVVDHLLLQGKGRFTKLKSQLVKVVRVAPKRVDYGDEDAGLIAVSSMGELRALTICSYASLNKRA